MNDRKAIQAHFAEHFPDLAKVKLRRGYVSLGPSIGVTLGIECLRTVAYLVGHRLADQIVVPIQGEVNHWGDIRWLLVHNGCLVAGNIVIIERVIYDHVKKEQSSTFYLREM